MIHAALALSLFGAVAGDNVEAKAHPISSSSSSSAVPVDLFRTSGVMQAHGLSESSLREALAEETHRVRSLGASSSASSSSSHPLLSCGPLSEMRAQRSSLMEQHGMSASDVRVAYQSREENLGCLLVHAAAHQIEAAGFHASSTAAADRATASNAWHYSAVPSFLKVQPSVIRTLGADNDSGLLKLLDDLNLPEHIKNSLDQQVASSLNVSATSTLESVSLKMTLLQGAASTKETPTAISSRIIKSAAKLAAQDRSRTAFGDSRSPSAWVRAAEKLMGAHGARTRCAVADKDVHVHSNAVIVTNVGALSSSCLTSIIQAATADPAVASISMAHTPHVSNHASRGAVQSGTIGSEPYSAAGLTGKNQIVSVIDTGLDDLSCFFAEGSCTNGDVNACLTPRDGSVNLDRRKVVQYTAYMDNTDVENGHGTHVAGTIMGSNVDGSFANSHGSMSGIAPDGKLAMQDMGDMYGYLYAMNGMSLYQVLSDAEVSGARIHSNSWGSPGFDYDYYAWEVDCFAYDHPESLMVFSAGNNGNNMYQAYIDSPGSAKNSLTVGTAQLKDPYDDRPLPQSTIASTSTIGPLMYGRNKPDVIAPGVAVVSSRSSDPANYDRAILTGEIKQSCSVIEMTGSSSAAAVAAGAAMLIRQYFEDESFWAASCGSSFSRCSEGAFTPTGYLLKAAILHAGDPMDYYGMANVQFPLKLRSVPDSYQGYGMINLATLLPLPSLNQPFKLYVQDDLAVSEGRVFTWNVTVSDAQSNVPLKATLVWYDPVDAFGLGFIVHDLDLAICDPEGNMYWGNGIDLGDSQNPNEQVTIASPRCIDGNCVYTVAVFGYSVATMPVQSFGIVLTTDGAVSEAVESDSTSFEYKKPGVTSGVIVNKVSDEVIKVDLGELILDDFSSVFTASFQVDAAERLSTVFLELNNWENLQYCPFYFTLTLTDPEGRSVVIGEWPYTFIHCLYGYGNSKDYYDHLGVDIYNLHGVGEWTVTIQPNNFFVEQVYGVKPSVTLTFPKAEVVYHEILSKISLSGIEWSIPIQISDTPPCSALSYFEVQFTPASPDFSAAGDFVFYLMDPSSRMLSVGNKFKWSWYFLLDTYHYSELVNTSGLKGNGLYSLLVYNNWGAMGGDLDIRLYFESQQCDVVDDDIVLKVVDVQQFMMSCSVENPDWVGDGFCDAGTYGYNTEGCAFDGGDCCVESCVSTEFYQCGISSSFECLDPKYSSCKVEHLEYIGDGFCNPATDTYNSADCYFDGGDCCVESCVDGASTCGSSPAFFCMDPAFSQCVVEDIHYIGDGYCDADLEGYNTASCFYDGGDCCEDSCVSRDYECGETAFVCIDPAYPGEQESYSYTYSYQGDSGHTSATESYGTSFSTSGHTSATESYGTSFSTSGEVVCGVEIPEWLGDGYCDSDSVGYNVAACGFDGGDCCAETCVSGASECGVDRPYLCLDPQYSSCTAEFLEYIGDSWCDWDGVDYNVEGCYFDGGDCCVETCVDGAYTCGVNSSFYCLDPAYSQCVVQYPDYIGDGYCDSDTTTYNTAECWYDGGDCCEDSCVSGPNDCGVAGFACVDPSYGGGGSDSYPTDSYGTSVVTSGADGSMTYSDQSDYSAAVSVLAINFKTVQSSVRRVSFGSKSRRNSASTKRYLEDSEEYLSLGYSYDSDQTSYTTSATYSYASNSYEYVPALTVIDEFDLDGELESVTIDLSGDELEWNTYLAYSLAVVVTDPQSRVLQIGDFNFEYDRANSIVMRWPENWLMMGNKYFNATRNVTAAGLSSTGPFSSNHWTVGILLAYDAAYIPNIEFKGYASLGFRRIIVPSEAPTFAPTFAPTEAPTVEVTTPSSTTFISFGANVNLGSIDCEQFKADALAQEVTRQATRDAMGLSDSEITTGKIVCPQANRRRVLRNLLSVGSIVEYLIRSNINRLGFSDPEAAFEHIVNQLRASISSGNLTSLIVHYSETMHSPLMQNISSITIEAISNFTVDTVSDSASSSSIFTGGILAGIVVGAAVGFGVIAAVVYLSVMRMKRAQQYGAGADKKAAEPSLEAQTPGVEVMLGDAEESPGVELSTSKDLALTSKVQEGDISIEFATV